MKKLFYTLICLLLVVACQRGEYPEPNLNVPEKSGELVVGKQKQNPYSVENMRKAFEALSPQTRSQVQISDISTTHLYVKFIPKTEDELDLLELDSTLSIVSLSIGS